MAKTKEQKKEIIKDLKEKLEKQKTVVLIDFEGLASPVLFQMRNELKENDCLLKIVKKTLLTKVLEDTDEKEFLEKVKQRKGQLGLILGFEDEVLPCKICYKYSKDNENLKMLGGIFEKKFNDEQYVLQLAQLPSKEELLQRMVGSLACPVSRFVHALKGNLNNLVFVLNEIRKVKT